MSAGGYSLLVCSQVVYGCVYVCSHAERSGDSPACLYRSAECVRVVPAVREERGGSHLNCIFLCWKLIIFAEILDISIFVNFLIILLKRK